MKDLSDTTAALNRRYGEVFDGEQPFYAGMPMHRYYYYLSMLDLYWLDRLRDAVRKHESDI